MSKAQEVVRKAEDKIRLRIEIQTEAKLRLLYAEQAMAAAKNGLNDEYERYTRLSEEARERHDHLKIRDAKLR